MDPGNTDSLMPAPAAMLLLLSYTCANVGIDLFAHRARVRWAPLWWTLLLACEALQASTLLWPLPRPLVAVAYNLSVAALLTAPILVFQGPLRREFGGWGLLPVLPGGVILVFAVLRSGLILAQPETAMASTVRLADNPTALRVALFAAGAFNVAFLALVVGRLVKRMHGLIDTDPLTGLVNRGGLERRLAEAWATSGRHGTPLSVAFIDLDDFKLVNDRSSHEFGDRVLQGVAQAVQQGARQTDHVGRWGGDEFMLVMPHTDHAAALAAVQRVRERVREAAIAMPEGCAPLGLSIGVATRTGADPSVQALVLRADAAMYGGKRDRAGLPGALVLD